MPRAERLCALWLAVLWFSTVSLSSGHIPDIVAFLVTKSNNDWMITGRNNYFVFVGCSSTCWTPEQTMLDQGSPPWHPNYMFNNFTINWRFCHGHWQVSPRTRMSVYGHVGDPCVGCIYISAIHVQTSTPICAAFCIAAQKCNNDELSIYYPPSCKD